MRSSKLQKQGGGKRQGGATVALCRHFQLILEICSCENANKGWRASCAHLLSSTSRAVTEPLCFNARASSTAPETPILRSHVARNLSYVSVVKEPLLRRRRGPREVLRQYSRPGKRL
eukprot:2848936-Pleurochrysis_carterae.AAC.2